MKILALLPLVLFPQQPATPSVDHTQVTLVLFTGLLVFVGFVTAVSIGWQSWETRKAAKAAHISAEATEKSVRLQETALRQWVNLDHLKAGAQPPFVSGMTEMTLLFTFDVTNPTKMPFTVEWLIVRVNGESLTETLHHFLPPDDIYPVKIPVTIRNKRVEEYGAYRLVR